MTQLKSLNFATLPKPEANPIMDRRARTIARLEEQKLLLKDPQFMRTVRITQTIDGTRTTVEKQQRVLRWWQHNIDGSCLFSIRSGSKTIEFERGKAAVVVASVEKLPAVIDALIVATKNGELDSQLAQAARPPAAAKRRPA